MHKKNEGVMRRIRLMTHGIAAEFWLIKSSCWCCTWLPLAFCAMGSLKWVAQDKSSPWSLLSRVVLGQSKGGGYYPLQVRDSDQGSWVRPRALAALLASQSMSPHRATAARAQSQEEWVSWTLSAPLKNFSLEAQQEQKSCSDEAFSHHQDTSSPAQQCL